MSSVDLMRTSSLTFSCGERRKRMLANCSVSTSHTLPMVSDTVPSPPQSRPGTPRSYGRKRENASGPKALVVIFSLSPRTLFSALMNSVVYGARPSQKLSISSPRTRR
jgi:hypothetical protein